MFDFYKNGESYLNIEEHELLTMGHKILEESYEPGSILKRLGLFQNQLSKQIRLSVELPHQG